jgi:protein-L-isoaspartate(D-aspartate) O-methyltransferase
MNNREQARFNMVEQQIRPWGVLDMGVLNLLPVIRREQFVPSGMEALAFMDIEIPLGHGASMWQPKMEARALQELHIQPADKVLEVGSGSGYLTALMSHLAAHVTSVEIVPELSEYAARKLTSQNIENVSVVVGDAANGWGTEQYDVIVLTGSIPMEPEALLKNLRVGGRMFAVVGDAPAMQAKLITRTGTDTFKRVALFETDMAPLHNAPQPERFAF